VVRQVFEEDTELIQQIGKINDHDHTREIACRPAAHGSPVFHWLGGGGRPQRLRRVCANLLSQESVQYASVIAVLALPRNAIYVVDSALRDADHAGRGEAY